MNDKERLKQEARDRWDDEWFLKGIEWADGDSAYEAHHSVQHVADGIVIRDIMELDDGEISVKRWLVNTTEYVAGIDDDE